MGLLIPKWWEGEKSTIILSRRTAALTWSFTSTFLISLRPRLQIFPLDHPLLPPSAGTWLFFGVLGFFLATGGNNPRRNLNQQHPLCQKGPEIAFMQIPQLPYAFLSSPVISFPTLVGINSQGTRAQLKKKKNLNIPQIDLISPLCTGNNPNLALRRPQPYGWRIPSKFGDFWGSVDLWLEVCCQRQSRGLCKWILNSAPCFSQSSTEQELIQRPPESTPAAPAQAQNAPDSQGFYRHWKSSISHSSLSQAGHEKCWDHPWGTSTESCALPKKVGAFLPTLPAPGELFPTWMLNFQHETPKSKKLFVNWHY